MDKKGQVSLGAAPGIVMIVGLVFMVMATLAFIAAKYGEAMPADNTSSVVNETLTTVNGVGERVNNASLCNFENFVVTRVVNATDGALIGSTNYTTTTDGYVKSIVSNNFNNTNWKVTYTASYTGVSCSVTNDLQTEISNNTSIAGIVLTISLVGIVLSVLVGVFVLARNRGM